MRKYIAKTNVSINIVLSSGANRHITFSALTGGGSVFYTNDPEIIQAMERHYKYGRLFRADPAYAADKQCSKPTQKQKLQSKIKPDQRKADIAGETPARPIAEEVGESGTTITGDENAPKNPEEDIKADGQADDNGLKSIVVSDPDSAKAYLAEHFGYSRTKIKTLKAITEAAAAHGIVFEGI